MLISPSIASSDLLHLADETEFASHYFHQIHIDIEDGVVCPNITMGMNVCEKICQKWNDAYRSIHLEVYRPAGYLEKVKKCNADIVFLQTDHLDDPLSLIKAYKNAGIPTGLSVSNRDDEDRIVKLLPYAEQVVICTNYIGDPERKFQNTMLEKAEFIARKFQVPVWLDGNVSYEIWKKLQNSVIYAAVMGGAVYRDKKLALKEFLNIDSN